MGLLGITWLLVRLTWFVTVGWILGGLYFLAMLLMSPFGTMASGRILNNSRKIMFLTTE